jgi:hypothetical protein
MIPCAELRVRSRCLVQGPKSLPDMLIMMNWKAKHLLLTTILCSSANLLAQEKPISQLAAIPVGNVSNSPAPAQTVSQSPETRMDLTWFNNTRTVSTSDNWSMGSVATALAASVQATVILPVGPVGIDTGGATRFGGPWGQYQIRITDGANSETVYVTGGTCTAGATRCTVVFKPYFSHSANAYTLGSATQGIQEAINDGCGLPPTAASWYYISGCHVIVPPRATLYHAPNWFADDYNVYGTIFLHTNQSKLSGYGAIINHYGRGPGLVVGYLTSVNSDGAAISGFPATAPSSLARNNTVEGISFRSVDNRSADPAYAGSLITSVAYSAKTHLNTITTAAPHGLRTGDMVTILFTDPTQFWGDAPTITVLDATTFAYYRNSRTDWPTQATPGIVALAYEPILDNGSGTNFFDVKMATAWESGAFNNWFDFWDDERCLVQGFDNGASSLNANINWTGSFFFSGGAYNLPVAAQQLAPVVTVANSNITANYSNGFSFFNSNGLYVHDTVIQAQGLWQANVSNVNGNYQGAYFENIYTETAPSLNPLIPVKSPWPGTGNAGLIAGPSTGAGEFNIKGADLGGSLPTYGSGSTKYVYSIVVNDVSTGSHSAPLPVMFGLTNGSGTLLVRWPRVANERDTITYHVIRNPAPLGITAVNGAYTAPSYTNCGGGSPSACGTVAVSLPQCSGFVCTFNDDVTHATSSIVSDLAHRNYKGNFSFWPATGAITSSVPIISDSEINTVGVGAEANTGSAVPVNYATRCYGSANVFGGYTACGTSTDTTNGRDSAVILNDYSYGKPNAKGRLNFLARGKPQELITLADADAPSTLATTGYRPKANVLDAYIGFDGSEKGFNGNAAPVAFGSPVSISNYIGSTPDDNAWKERLTLTSKKFKVPVDFQSSIAYEISGPEVAKPSPPAAGVQKAFFKAGSGLCTVDSRGAERCMRTDGGTSSETLAVPDTADNPWFTATHVSESGTVFSSIANMAAFFGVILPFPKTTTQVTYSVSTADTASTTYDIGIYSGTSGGTCALMAHTGPVAGSTAMTAGYHTVKWKGAAVKLRPGRYYLAITASATSSLATLAGESGQITFAGGASQETVGNVTVTEGGKLDATRMCPTDSYIAAVVPVFAVN